MEHVKLQCVRRHWFLMPTAMLADRPAPTWRAESPRERPRRA